VVPPAGQPHPPAGPRWVQIDPRDRNIRPIHPVGTAHWNRTFVVDAQKCVPFDHAASDAIQPIQVVEFNGEYFVFSGHHRIFAIRNLYLLSHPAAPATVRVQIFTPSELANSPDADVAFQNNVPIIMALIHNSLTTNALFPIT
jgi:hypothetical protein